MEVNSKKHMVTSCDELLNHTGWRERVSSRGKIKGHGNRMFRTFELDCGNDYHMTISLTEAIGLSLATLKTTKPYVTTTFHTTYGKWSPRMTDIVDCKDRSSFFMKLYQTLAKRFPLTDIDIQSAKVLF